jgi:non-specific serine/threonine protein kinase
VPGRAHYRLRQRLGPSPASEVWLARHEKTGEARVFKFSVDGCRLPSLKREATIYRVLHDSLGERDDFVRVLDWNFEQPPFHLECEYAGPDLATWARDDAALASMDPGARLALFLRIADGIAAAHRVGVLHKDIKPANVLIEARGNGWRPRIADFGSSRLLEPGRLEELGITALGLTVTQALLDDYSGTPLYLAPELLAGRAPTVQSDVYALGLLLYQLMVGDFRRPLAPGWEQDIGDALLREDIAAATDGNPARRLGSVDELCQRLRDHDARRDARACAQAERVRTEAMERRLQRLRARRPWIAALLLVLGAALALGLWQYQRTRRARDDAEHQAAIAAAANRFLNDDLLGAGVEGRSPAWYESNPTLRDVLDVAAQRVDAHFRGEPLTAADVHLTLARAYRSTGAFEPAAQQSRAAVDLLRSALGPADAHVARAGYELAIMLAHLSRFDEAAALLTQTDEAANVRPGDDGELALRSHLAHGDVAYQRMRFADALAHYRAAQPMQQRLHADDAVMSAHLFKSIAGCELRLGHPREAEAAARRVLAGAPYTEASVGLAALADARLTLGNALRSQGRYGDAIPVVRQALAGFTRVEGESGQGTIAALSTLGHLLSLNGDDAGAFEIQRDVYQRSQTRWGADNQYTLVELLNLGLAEQDRGDNADALEHVSAALDGLAKLGNGNSPAAQAGRVAKATLLSDMGHDAEALALIRTVDPVAYQASTSDPARAAELEAIEARIMLRLGRRAEALPKLRAAVAALEAASVSADEIAPFRALLTAPATKDMHR